MLRVTKADGWLPRAQNAGTGRQGSGSSGSCVVIRSGGCLPGGYPPVPVDLPGAEAPGQAVAAQDCRRSVCQPDGSGPSSGWQTFRLQLVLIPPGTRGMPHLHPGRETAGYLVSGEAEVWHGAGLIRRSVVRAGDFIYIPPGTPHLAVNRGDVTSIAVVACPSQAGSVTVELPRHLAGLLSYPVGYAG